MLKPFMQMEGCKIPKSFSYPERAIVSILDIVRHYFHQLLAEVVGKQDYSGSSKTELYACGSSTRWCMLLRRAFTIS